MPNLTVAIPHQLGRAEAKRRIQDQIGVLRTQAGSLLADATESWTGDRMDFSIRSAGQTFSGHLLVDDQAVHVDVALPWLLSLLAGPYQKKLESDMRRLLAAPAKTPT